MKRLIAAVLLVVAAPGFASPLAGPPAPATLSATAPRRESSRVAVDAFWLGLGWSADVASTEWALGRCSSCYEANPLIPSVEARMGAKLVGNAVALGACYQLRRAGHHRAASVVRWAGFGLQVAAAASNSRHALRRR